MLAEAPGTLAYSFRVEDEAFGLGIWTQHVMSKSLSASACGTTELAEQLGPLTKRAKALLSHGLTCPQCIAAHAFERWTGRSASVEAPQK